MENILPASKIEYLKLKDTFNTKNIVHEITAKV